MATNSIASSLYAAPVGLDAALSDMEDPLSEAIEIVLDDGTTLLEAEVTIKGAFDDNLAETMDEGDLGILAEDLLDHVEADITSRKEWVEALVQGMDVLGMKYEERTEPWTGACGVYSTILLEAAIRFQADTITETFPASGPARTKIVGAIDKLKEEAAERVQDDMNFRLTEKMPEFRPEHEKMLFSLGLSGAAFKKVYYETHKKRQTSRFVSAEDIIIPYGAADVVDAERVTHVMRKTKNEVRRLMMAGFYRELDLGEPQSFHSDIEKKKAEDQGYTLTEDERYQLLEVHADIVLPGGDPYAKEEADFDIGVPYIITIDRGTRNVLAVRRNWREDDETKQKRQHFVQYTYIPGFGAYGLGLIHLIGGYARAGTSLIRQLVDAGTLSNLPGGMKTRGMRLKGDDTPISPGEWRDVDIPSGALRDNIMPLPYKEPSATLLQLHNQLMDEGRRLGSIADMQTSDMSAQAPVGSTLAVLERQLKTTNAVQSRVHASFAQELKLLHGIIRDYLPPDYSYTPDDGEPSIKQADYDMVDVIPVSDPSSSTMAQRIMQYQAAMQMAQGAPQIYDQPQLHRKMLEVLGIKDADKLVPTADDQTPRDPVSENMSFLTGKPTKAFIEQDHDAHIAVHSSMMKDPMMMAQIGQTPMGQQMQAAIMAHIAEHLAFQYRAKIQQQLGARLPAPDAKLDPEIESQLSALVAQAAVQLLEQHQQMAAQQQAQQMQQDPLMQLKQAEMQVKQQELQIKQMKVQQDGQLKQQDQLARQQIEEQRLQIEAAKVGVMGRSQDPAILQEDRTNALRLQQETAMWDMQNQVGEAQQEMNIEQQKHAMQLQQEQQRHEQKMLHEQQRMDLEARMNAAKADNKPSGS